ncbi:hypothetical protein ACFQZQ_11310 [Lysobacter koreensis]|uniref:Uncharacterized protein n=1 Tax=Lysobacter koreensis TaxID=266122 RepID=A0ABW2YPQ6_9GAMM
MDQRILYGCIAALGVMLGFDLLTRASGVELDLPVSTPLGSIATGGVLVTFAAMTLGAWIARRDFRWVALALNAVLWVMVIAVLHSVAMPTDANASLSAILKFSGLGIVLSLAASWLGAMLGQRLAARRGLPATP